MPNIHEIEPCNDRLIVPDPDGRIKEYIRDRQTTQEGEKSCPQWSSPDHHHNLLGYEYFFNEVFPRRFAEFLEEYRQSHEGHRTSILDFMGWGHFFREMASEGSIKDLHGGVSLSYGHPSPIDTYYDGKRKIKIAHVQGDLFLEKTWLDLQKGINSIGASNVGLIVSIPGGGWEWMPKKAIIFEEIIKRLWNVLANDGMMLMQIPWWIDDSGINGLVREINLGRPQYNTKQMPDAAVIAHSQLMLRKYANWPKNLPEMSLETSSDLYIKSIRARYRT